MCAIFSVKRILLNSNQRLVVLLCSNYYFQPEGGSVQGQKFAVPYKPGVVHATSVQANITGAWKDDIFDCSTFGVCHPSLVNACCCPLILLGQVMTRLKLDWLAKPASDADFKQTFSTMACIFAVYAVVSLLFSPVDPDEPSPIYNLVNFIYGVFLLVIMTQVRKIVRAKYEIPEERCIGCEDLCCAFWCSCCTVAQLARQTADYDSEEAAFFTNDGLAKSSMTPVLTV